MSKAFRLPGLPEPEANPRPKNRGYRECPTTAAVTPPLPTEPRGTGDSSRKNICKRTF
jgi:hypothetical protein